jgi:protein gp37
MGENSTIEWTHHTFNPWVGCQKVSPGCDHCYAEGWAKRTGSVQWGPHADRRRTTVDYWKKPLKWNRDATRYRVFCASLADWLDNKVPDQWRVDLAALIRATPNLDWLLLTKRIENYARLAPWVTPPDNVWIGVTAEDQEHYDRRWKILQAIPAAVRFISYEPAIGPLTLGDTQPDWVICGGESGGKARMMDPQWARDLREECKHAGIAFFMKQMTRKAVIPLDLLVREFPMMRSKADAA